MSTAAIDWVLRGGENDGAIDLPSSRSVGRMSVFAVLIVLAEHADDTGATFPSERRIAAETGLGFRRSVKQALELLQEAGLIREIAPAVRGRRGTTYQLLAELDEGPPTRTGDKARELGQAQGQEQGQAHGQAQGQEQGRDTPARTEPNQTEPTPIAEASPEERELTLLIKHAAEAEACNSARKNGMTIQSAQGYTRKWWTSRIDNPTERKRIGAIHERWKYANAQGFDISETVLYQLVTEGRRGWPLDTPAPPEPSAGDEEPDK